MDVMLYTELYNETYKLLLTMFWGSGHPWIYVSPTVHGLLAHTSELIVANDGYGLGKFAESGLENNNKFLRFYRMHLARKVDQPTNLTDCMSRLWVKSDPIIRAAAPKPSCSHCKTTDHFTRSCPLKSTSINHHYFLILLNLLRNSCLTELL